MRRKRYKIKCKAENPGSQWQAIRLWVWVGSHFLWVRPCRLPTFSPPPFYSSHDYLHYHLKIMCVCHMVWINYWGIKFQIIKNDFKFVHFQSTTKLIKMACGGPCCPLGDSMDVGPIWTVHTQQWTVQILSQLNRSAIQLRWHLRHPLSSMDGSNGTNTHPDVMACDLCNCMNSWENSTTSWISVGKQPSRKK